MMRDPLNFLDSALVQFDQALRTCIPGSTLSQRPSPASSVEPVELSETDRQHAAGLMRINHTGEVCAQALYAGQASTAQLDQVRESMEEAAADERDHLAWCEMRLTELQSRPSLLNPLWYAMSFGLGAAAGLAGDKWSLGFVAETEKQVCEHLETHLGKLPEADHPSKAVLTQMIQDERHHGQTAEQAGGAPLPFPVRKVMLGMSQIMKRTTYRV